MSDDTTKDPAKATALAAQSRVIDGIRMPLMLAVIFIHSYGPAMTADATGLMAAYEYLRIAGSHVLTHCCVPAFFLISGYLFFFNIRELDKATYVAKLRRRVRSLFIPYLLWNVLYIGCIILAKYVAIRFMGRDPDGLPFLLHSIDWHWFWDSHWWSLDHWNLFGFAVAHSSPALVPLWYLRDLIILSMLTPLLYYLLKHFGRAFVGLLVVLYLLNLWPNIPGLSITGLCYFTVGAYVGLSKQLLTETLYRYRHFFAIATILLFFPELMFNGSNTLVGLTIYPYFIFATSISAFNLASWLERRGHLSLSIRLAPATFFVYALHSIYVVAISGFICKHLLPWETPLSLTARYLFAPFLTCALCLLGYYLMARICPSILQILIGGRKK